MSAGREKRAASQRSKTATRAATDRPRTETARIGEVERASTILSLKKLFRTAELSFDPRNATVILHTAPGSFDTHKEYEEVARCLKRVEERRAEMREGDKEIARLRRETKRLIAKMKAM